MANEPKYIYQGTTVKWTESLADHPADEWTLVYRFRGGGTGFDVEAVANGADFDLSISAEDTGSLAVGEYTFQATTEKDGEIFLVAEGIVTIRAGLSLIEAETTIETRSVNRIILDKITAMISGSMDKNVQEYSINNRQLRHYALSELIALEKYYQQKVSREVTNNSGANSPFLKSRKFNHVKAK